MPIFVRCGKCGKRIKRGDICQCVSKRYKEDDKYKRDIEKWYNSREWKSARKRAIEHCAGLDIIVYLETGEIIPGEIVHHIVPLEESWEMRCSIENLVYITERTHRKLHEAMKHDRNGVIRYVQQKMKIWEEIMGGYR